MTKVALAYSGSLDTTICTWYLRNIRGLKVITFSANIGQPEYLEPLAERAVELGAFAAHVADLRERFVTDYIFPCLKADAAYQGVYYMFSAIARPLIVQELIAVAREEGAEYVAHGSRGAGNDLIRFRTCVEALAPDLQILTPLEDLHVKTIAEEIEYAKLHKIPFEQGRKTLRNVEQNLWGSNIQIHELDAWEAPPPDARLLTDAIEDSPAKPTIIEVDFVEGVPTAIDGEALAPAKMIETLNKLGGRNAVGRIDVVEDRILPRKMREIYEAPAAEILYTAHRALESLTLDRETRRIRLTLGARYADLVYAGQWFSPIRASLAAFFDELNKRVTGRVRLRLHRGHATVEGMKSPHSLYQPSPKP